MVRIGCISLCVSRIYGAWWVEYDYGCGGGVSFGGHYCPLQSFYGGFYDLVGVLFQHPSNSRTWLV